MFAIVAQQAHANRTLNKSLTITVVKAQARYWHKLRGTSGYRSLFKMSPEGRKAKPASSNWLALQKVYLHRIVPCLLIRSNSKSIRRCMYLVTEKIMSLGNVVLAKDGRFSMMSQHLQLQVSSLQPKSHRLFPVAMGQSPPWKWLISTHMK